ncbi:MAG: arsenate reductase like protein [Fluviicola sp.]|uniref:arsenate reductase family protein n=1 Tax=Fluviicola sp. TaxID=1917219 RepID=UPI0026123E51|nr:ArsC/Spx/MgsR family protein [Fluviicola sp.]MDF3029292.1 arsenate reductase like protein [Fluviicola sp.]
MRRFYYLSSCDTCQKIMKALNLPADVELIDIKQSNIDAKTLDWLKEKVGSYEGMFSKRAMKFRSQGLHEMNLTEADYRKYMLEEYTFLKRPFTIYDEHVWIGNAKKEVEAAQEFFAAKR